MDANTIQLLCQMERERSLQKLVDLSFQLLGNPIFYQDVELNIPYYTRCVEIQEPFWQCNVVQGNLSNESIMQGLGQSEMMDSLPVKHEPVELPPNPFHNNGQINYAFPLSTGNVFHGVLILASICRDFQPEDKLLFQLFGEIFYSRLAHDLSLGVSARSLNSSLIIKLLSGDAVSPAYIESQLSKMNWHPMRYLWLISICATENAESTSTLADVISVLNRSRHGCLVRYQSSLVYLHTSDTLAWSVTEALPELIALMKENHLCAGCSRPFTQLTRLQFQYHQAQQAISMGQRMDPNQCIYRFGDLAAYCMLDQWYRQGSLEDQIEPGVIDLWLRDRQNPVLLPTLDMYLNCGMDAGLTAERLYVHKNTVRYRIGRCEEILQRNLTDGETLFRLKLSLKAIDYLGKIGKSSELIQSSSNPDPSIS